MRIMSHAVYLSLLALMTTAWLYERTLEDDNSMAGASVQQSSEPLQKKENKPKADSSTIVRGTQQPSYKSSDVQTEIAEPADLVTPHPEPAIELDKVLQKRVADRSLAFAEQDYHPDWSIEVRQQLSDLFLVYGKELENFDVVDIDCKTSICRVQTEIAGEYFMQIMELQRVLVEQKWFGDSDEIAVTANENGQPHDIYISIEN